MDFLSNIVKQKALEVAERKRAGIDATCDDLQPREFGAAIAGGGISVISEFKRRSPSTGELCHDVTLVDVARCYAENGAAALSVLTDEPFFGGTPADLTEARSAVPLPVLRKDFIIDPFQIHESRAAGADAVLLIVRALSADLLRELLQLATDLKMDALVEVHDAQELQTAVEVGARIIGVNNRNLDTFEVRLETSLELHAMIPSGVLTVAESGVKTRDDVLRLSDVGFDAILVGEALMTATRPGEKLRELMKGTV